MIRRLMTALRLRPSETATALDDLEVLRSSICFAAATRIPANGHFDTEPMS